MAGIVFLSENLVNDASISVTTGTENAQFPLVNIKNEATAIKFRSIENNIVLVFDLLQTREIDAVAVHGDTNTTLGLTAASFKTSLTTDFSLSASHNLDISAEYGLGFKFLDTSVNHRFLELTLIGSGSYVELSNIFIGKKIELLQQNLSISSFRYGHVDRSLTDINQYGQRFIDKRNVTKVLSGTMEFCIKDEQEILDEMFVRHGKSEPIWMIVDKDGQAMNDGNFKLTIYGYLNDVPEWSASGGQTYNADIEINQAG